MKTRFILLNVTVFLLAAMAGVQGQVTAFTYQGQLSEDGSPANGVYDFEFYLFAVDSGGVAIAGPESASGVAVSNGLFTATVDFGSGRFDGTELWLEVGVRTNGGGGFTALAPRTEVTSTPYSVFASTVASIPDNSVGSAQVIDSSLKASDLGANSVEASEIAADAVGSSEIAPDAVGTSEVADGSLLGVDIANNAVGSAQLADSIALGSASAAGQLDVFSATSGGPAVSLFGTGVGGYQRLYQGDGQTGILLDGDSGGGGVQYLYAADGSVGVALDGDSGGAGYVSIRGTNNGTRVALDGYANNGGGGQITVYAADGSSTVQLYGEDAAAGLINVNNSVSQTRVAIDGEGSDAGGQINLLSGDGDDGITLFGGAGGGGLQYLHAADGSIGVLLDGESVTGGGEVSVRDASGRETVEILGQYDADQGAIVTLKQDNGFIGILMEAEYGGNGEGGAITLNNGLGNTGLRLEGDVNDGGYAAFYSSAGNHSIILNGDSGNGGAVYVYGTNSSSYRVSLDGIGTYQGGEVRVRDSSGSSRIILYGEDSNGDGHVVCDVMEIRGGSDLSEQFDVKSAREAVQPGAVVCIDPENPGKLKVSSKAYDRTVAGVVSGAGGVKTGMMMGQNGTVADGQHPVALTGRVYCLVDANQGAVAPGDLITTSSTPGHGMKVADHVRAQGAILGKAMTSLASGKGLVLVLVSLQ